MMKDIVIIGAGGFAREVAWLIERNNEVRQEWNILGFVDEGRESDLLTYPIVGNDEWLLKYPKEIHAAICIGSASLRKKIAAKFKECPNIRFPSLISADACVGRGNVIGDGAIICAGTIITVNARIGAFSIINLDCTIGHEAVLDKCVTLYPSVNISGDVHIGEAAEIGTGATVIQGVHIGSGTIVGASAAVVNNLPSNCTAVGIPAKVIKKREIQVTERNAM